MRKRHFLSVAVTLGLVISLFSVMASNAGAESSGRVGGNPLFGSSTAALYVPWVHNGDSPDGFGPFYGTVTVMNNEEVATQVTITSASGVATGPFRLNANASKTFSAATLGLASGGEGVKVSGAWDTSASNLYQVCTPVTQAVTRGAASGGVDTFPVAFGGTLGAVTSVYMYTVPAPPLPPVPTKTTFSTPTDYTWGNAGSGTVNINWGPSGAEPAAGAIYYVNYLDCERAPFISAVEKHMDPAGSTALSSSSTIALDGYTALSNLDLGWTGNGDALSLGTAVGTGPYQTVLPIAQTNNGWDTVLHVTNFGANFTGATITFYPAFGQGAAGPSFGPFSQTLKSGQTWSFDLSAMGIPADWVGAAFISADDTQVVTMADRVKPSTTMALSTVAAPWIADFSKAPFVQYAPLVFKSYNGWNTGINIANTEPFNNTINITYYNQSGNAVAQDQITIPSRGMEYVYRPNVGDVGLGPTSITSAILSSNNGFFQAAVDEVKYTGATSTALSGAGQGQGHAMSYIATSQAAPFGAVLSLPLWQKGSMTGSGDTSGINVFNPDPNNSITGDVEFYDSTGAHVAPTLISEGPMPLTLAAHEGATVYSLDLSEQPQGFQGAVEIEMVAGAGSMVGVSNNVNYDVMGDGSAVYNLTSTCGNFVIGCNVFGTGIQIPTSYTAVAHNTFTGEIGQTVTARTDQSPAEIDVQILDQHGDPYLTGGVQVCAKVISGPNAGADLGCTASDLNGQAFLYDPYTASSNGLGTDQIQVWVDLNGNGTVDTGETAIVNVIWIAGPAAIITLAPATQAVTPPGTASFTAQVTDAFGNPIVGATVNLMMIAPSVNSGTATCAATDATGTATCSFAYVATASPGTDTWQASTVNILGTTIYSNTVTVTVNTVATITLAPASQSVTPPGTATFTAHVQDQTGAAVVGVTPTLTTVAPNVNTGTATCAATDAAGNSTCTFAYVAGSTAGTDTWQATVTTSGGTATSNTVTVSVAQVVTTVTLAPANQTISAATGGTATFTVNVTDQTAAPIAGVTPTLATVAPNVNTGTGTCAATDAAGNSTCTFAYAAGATQGTDTWQATAGAVTSNTVTVTVGP